MIRVEIVSIPTKAGMITYHAVAGDKQSQGSTAGEALDALTTQLPEEETGTLVLVQSFRPDRYFTIERQDRLAELMGRWRAARDAGEALSGAEQSELEALIDEELRASARRTSSLLDELAG